MESSNEKLPSDMQVEQGEQHTAEFQKRESALVWKLDCYIAPVMMLLMLISYLDRGNVSS